MRRSSHAVRRPAFSGGAAGGELRELPLQATAREVSFGLRVLAALAEVPAYARVDMLPLDCGDLVLCELELIEPALYLASHPASAQTFARVIQGRLRAPTLSG